MELFTEVTLLAAGAVVIVQQILKLNLVPLGFANKYPVPTNILLSVAAAIVAVWQTNVQPSAWTEWATLVGLISVVAAITYNQLVSKWTELKQMEGQG